MESETKRIKENPPPQGEKPNNNLISPQKKQQEKPLEQNAQQANPQQQMIPQGQQQPVLLQHYLQNQQPFIYQQPYGQPIIVGYSKWSSQAILLSISLLVGLLPHLRNGLFIRLI